MACPFQGLRRSTGISGGLPVGELGSGRPRRRASWQGPGHYLRGAPLATAPGVALPPASLQSCGQSLPNSLNSQLSH